MWLQQKLYGAEGASCAGLASASDNKGSSEVPGICQLLLKVHQELQHGGSTSHLPPQGFPMSTYLVICCWVGVHLPQTQIYYGTYPPSARSFLTIHCGVGCLRGQSGSHALPMPRSSPQTVAFYSKKLSPVEKNYNVGDQEQFASKLVWHWIEWPLHPFVVYTDHLNLEYISQVGSLLHWIPVHHFTSSPYRLGYKNADALSRIHDPEPSTTKEQPIFEPACLVTPLGDWPGYLQGSSRWPWTLWQATRYIPVVILSKLIITWAHAFIASGHPGATWAAELLSDQYCWLSHHHDVQRLVNLCSIYVPIPKPLDCYQQVNSSH